jgi:hypothetical protein
LRLTLRISAALRSNFRSQLFGRAGFFDLAEAGRERPTTWPLYLGATFAIEKATNVLAAAEQRFDVDLPPDVRLSW